MVRADGDALVMHVGERPYVVVGAGTLDLSTQILNLDAMTGMLQQLLPTAAQDSLEEFGAVEHRLQAHEGDTFTVVAARGGDDIWIEIRRRRQAAAVVAAVAAPPAPVAADPPPSPIIVESVAPPVVVEAIAAAEVVPVIEAPPVEEPVIVEMAVVADELPVLDELPVVDELPVLDELPALDEPVLVVDEAAVLAEEAALVAETPDAVVFDWPVVDQVEPLVEDEPAVAAPVLAAVAPLEELPVVDELPVADEPIVIAEPLAIDEPVLIDEAPSVEVLEDLLWPQAGDAPPVEEIPLEMSAVLESPAVAEAPVAFEAPVAVEPPAVFEPPAAINAPAAFQAPETQELAPVLQMTRTVRIEVPPRSTAARGSGVERLLRLAAARTASALFVTSDCRPSIRVEGDIRPLEGEAAMSRADVEAAVMEIVPEAEQEAVGRGESTEWITEFADLGRVRCITFTDHRGPGVVFRMIATRAATAEQLGLSREVQALATEPQGLVLVAGAHGTGKSTLMSALVDLVNRQRAEYVVILERQIRLVHDNRTAIVSQREIRGGAEEALSAARAALREDPDVLVVDDLISAQMVPLLLEAASEALVFVSVTARSTTDAVERFVELAPADARAGVQAAMAESFRGAVAQVLLKKAGGGRVAAREVLLASAAVTRVISDGVPGQLQVALEGGRKYGMVPLADVLVGLVQSGVVDVREAFRKSPDRDRLLASLKREGVDTSVVERLA